MLSSETWRRIYNHLSVTLGCAEETLRAPGLRVLAHGSALAAYHGVYVWRMAVEDGAAPSITVSAPPALVDEARAALTGAPMEGALDPAFWLATLGPRMERVVGPSYQGYLDAGVFQPVASNPARPLAADERPALARLARACAAEEWEHSAIEPDHDPIFVVSGEDGTLMAAASLTRDGDGLVAVGVIAHRRRAGAAMGARWSARSPPGRWRAGRASTTRPCGPTPRRSPSPARWATRMSPRRWRCGCGETRRGHEWPAHGGYGA